MTGTLAVLVCMVLIALDTSALRRYLIIRPATQAVLERAQYMEKERAELEQQRFEWLKAPSEPGKTQMGTRMHTKARGLNAAKARGLDAAKARGLDATNRGPLPTKRFRSAGLPSSARLDLPFVLRASDGAWRAVLGALITDLYGQQPFFQGSYQRRPALIEQLLEELAGQLPSVTQSQGDAHPVSPDADWIVLLRPRDPELALIFRCMVEGNGVVPSLREYISMSSWHSSVEPRIQLQVASFALRRALLGKEINDAFELRYRELIAENARPSPFSQNSDWRLPVKRALTSRQCRELLCAILKEHGQEPGDWPLFKALDFGTHSKRARDGDFVVRGKRSRSCRVIHPRQRG